MIQPTEVLAVADTARVAEQIAVVQSSLAVVGNTALVQVLHMLLAGQRKSLVAAVRTLWWEEPHTAPGPRTARAAGLPHTALVVRTQPAVGVPRIALLVVRTQPAVGLLRIALVVAHTSPAAGQLRM